MTFVRPDIVRPPSEHASYYLPLTAGCSNNTCVFCMMWNKKLHMRDLAEVKEEIDALALYQAHGVRLPGMPPIVYHIADQWDGQKIFLQDGDALVYPYPQFKEILHYINEKLPQVDRIGTYATPKDILRRTVDELVELRKLKLGIIYMGIESGDDEILQRIRKGATSQEIIDAGRRIKEAGITSSVTVILGIGSVENSDKHALATARVLTAVDPDFAGALTLTLVPGTPIYDWWQKGEFTLIDPFRSLEELKIILENTTFTNCFFSSMHASNYVSVRGILPQDKEIMLNQLSRVLQNRDEKNLRPEFLRGL
ncbi:MAG: radical SAM protein [Dehalococcoidales bacterium]|nr:radical SAM protein [Dehalococcoidales bacterium]